jgi:hypothetical protein
MRSVDGSTRPWHNSSIFLSFTQEPSQDPLGKGARVAPPPEAAPLPFYRGTFGAILVRIYINRMVVVGAWNPNLVG